MNQETAFRAVLGVGFLAVLLVGLHHRLRSGASKEPLDRRQEGIFVLATLRPIGLLLWLGVVTYLVNPAWMAWSSVPLPAWLRWSGVGVFTVVTRRAHTLVTQGPYRWVRHPFYDAMALLIVAIVLTAANWFVFVTGAAVFLLLAVRAQTEEAHLLARFGDAYRTYSESTGRFVPKLRRTIGTS